MKRTRTRPPSRHKVQKLATVQANLSNTHAERAISANTLKMKFMQRGEEAARRERLREEADAEAAAAQWAVAHARRVVEDETSIAAHKVGRRSFGHFNVAVERLAEQQLKEARRAREQWHQNAAKRARHSGDDSEEEADVREELMAATLSKHAAHQGKRPRTD